MTELRVSVIIPVHNGGQDLAKVLDAIARSDFPYHECILVDDASTDGMTRQAADSIGATVIELDKQQGPSAARNQGVAASSGDIAFFIDADVVVHSDTISKGVEVFEQHPEVAAVFGSYDDEPGHETFISKYRNLYHHWIHQTGRSEATTFWTGCGAIRRATFDAIGGFDLSFSRPSIEDIEFGGRLIAAGNEIRLEKSMLCSHLKRWTFLNVVFTDVFQRGIPWMTLLLEKGDMPNDLNVSYKARLATILAGILALLFAVLPMSGWGSSLIPTLALLAGCVICSWFALSRGPMALFGVLLTVIFVALAFTISPWPIALVPFLLIMTIIWTQSGFYALVARKHNLAFAFAVIPMQVIFFLGCGFSAAAGIFIHFFEKIRGPAAR